MYEVNLNVFSREFGSRLNSRLNNSTIMITSNPTKSVVDMKLYEFSKNFGIAYAIDDMITKIEPVIRRAFSTISFVSSDLK